MGKFTLETKLKAVLEYQEGYYSFREIGKKVGVHHSSIGKWVALYNAHGLEGLKRNKYTNYNTQFKMDVLNYMNDQGTSLVETAAIFNIAAPATVLQWRREFEKQGALFPKKRGRQSMKKDVKVISQTTEEALRAENEKLRMEIAYLKKLNALIQEKEKLQNKTKRW